MLEWRVVIFCSPVEKSHRRLYILSVKSTLLPYINFALINCGTFHAIFISFVKVTGLKP